MMQSGIPANRRRTGRCSRAARVRAIGRHGNLRRRAMHQIKIADWAIEQTRLRRGRLHVHEDLDPRKTALIVVDMQNGFCVEEVAAAYVPYAAEIVPAINRLAAAVRRTGGKVFWIKQTVDEESAIAWSEWLGMMNARDAPTPRHQSGARLARPRAPFRPRREARGRDRAEISFQCLRPGRVRSAAAAARAGLRHGADHRHGHECLLRVVGA